MNQEDMKKAAALAALDYIDENTVVGVGTGSTANYFIDALAKVKSRIEGTVASSEASAQRLKSLGIPVFDLNAINHLPIYVDGADQINQLKQLIKGGGGAMTREKIIASAADKFICIADESKIEPVFGDFPIAIEVLPSARSYVARQIVKMGGDPVYREGFTTDNGNIILDVYHLPVLEPIKLEQELNHITGVVCHGLFAIRSADVVLLGTGSGVKVL